MSPLRDLLFGKPSSKAIQTQEIHIKICALNLALTDLHWNIRRLSVPFQIEGFINTEEWFEEGIELKIITPNTSEFCLRVKLNSHFTLNVGFNIIIAPNLWAPKGNRFEILPHPLLRSGSTIIFKFDCNKDGRRQIQVCNDSTVNQRN